jgi:hypothetical protein
LRRPIRIAGAVSAAVVGGWLALAGTAAAQDVPASDDPGGPLIDLDWSVALRGSYTADSAKGSHYEAIVAPEVSLTRHYLGGDASVGAGAAVSIDQNKAVRVDEAHANAASSFTLDHFTTLKGSLSLSDTQLSPFDSSLPANTLSGPNQLTGTATGSATRRLGQFELTGTLTGERFIKGPTTLADLSTIDNSDQSFWMGQASLRTGLDFTAKTSVFVEASEAYTLYDTPSPSLLVYTNNRTLQLRGGVAFTQPGTLTAELSAGRAWIDYADPSLTDRPAWVANGSVSFTPDETVTLAAALDTSIGPSSNTAGDTDVAYTLSGNAAYRVNPWLNLRGSAGFSHTVTLGTAAVDQGYSAGIGADLSTSRHTAWTFDYLYSHDQKTGNPPTDSHTVTLGLTFRK